MRHTASRLVILALVMYAVPVMAATAKTTRLDANVAPTSQTIELELDADRVDYRGTVRIELEVDRPTRSFRFHAEEMKLDRVELRGKKGEVGLKLEPGDHGMFEATAERKLGRGSYTLEIDFSKEYNTRAVGLYRMEKDGLGYLFTQFEAVDARKAFPCWDEPIFKIPFQMTVRIPEGQNVVTNTPVASVSEAGGVKTVAFRKTKPMPTYLLAIAAGPLESAEIPGLSVPGRVYTVKGQRHLAALAAELTPPILEALEEYFGRRYPYAKLDLIAIPEYWPGAMENPGAVTFADRILLVDPKAASITQRRTLALVTAHELAHMWFGDLVTMAWWDDLWLNESFADWLGEKITARLFPEYKVELWRMRQVQGLMRGDARPSSAPIRKPINTPAEIWEDLGLAYGKGKQVLRMVEQWIGEEAFRKGVVDYVNANEWGNTVAGDLFDALSGSAGRDLEGIFSSFLDQPGYPMVSLALQPDGALKLRQERFVNADVEAPDLKWKVPIRLKYSDGTTTHTRTFLLEERTAEIHLDVNVAWAMPDGGAFGYYRWIAPEKMMTHMAANPGETLDERERAAFLGNTRALLSAGEVGGGSYLGLLSAFAKSARPEIVDAMLADLDAVETALVTDDLNDEFAYYVRETLRPALERFGLEAAEGEAKAVSLLRPRMIERLGAHGRQADVRKHCRKLARAYMDDPASVDPTLAGVALRVAAIEGTAEDFEAYKDRFEKARVPAERQRYLSALGAFEDTGLQDRALDYILSGSLRPTELFAIPGGVASTAAGRDKVYRWLTENYDAITAKIPPDFAAFMPFFVSGCSEERLQAAREFFDHPGHSVDGTAKNLAKVADQVGDCINLREREAAAVADYLSRLAAGRERGAR
ncbi:MAG: M1 family metallopeptidase [Candidatus Krumholzibacteriia bacterium]